MNNLRGKRLLFVGGAPRSGTTLVQNILDSHPEIAGGPEFDHSPEFIFLRRVLHQSIQQKRISVFVDAEDVDRELSCALEGMLLTYAERKKKKILSEKTPWNVLFFRELMELFPEAKFLLVIRDPRAVSASLMNIGKSHSNWCYLNQNTFLSPYVYDAIDIVRYCADLAQDVIDENRVHVCLYEQLIEDVELETRKITEFIGVDWSSDMLHPEKHEHDGGSALQGVCYQKNDFNNNIDSSKALGWEKSLRPWQRLAIESTLSNHPLFINHGYILDTKKYSLQTRVIERVFRALHTTFRLLRWKLFRLSGIKTDLIREIMIHAIKSK